MKDPVVRLSVVIPAYNEIGTIAEVVRRVEAIPVEKEIVLVDNCSTDGTREWIRDYRPGAVPIKKVLHEANTGKGSSIRDGMEAAEGEIAVIQDADLEYDPEEIPMLMEPIENGEADVVIGSRVLGGKDRAHLLYDLGGRLLNAMTNALFGGRYSDCATCYKMMKKNVYKKIRLEANGFDLDFEIPARFLLLGLRIAERPISYHPRSLSQGKKIKMRDGLRAIGTLLKVRLKG